MFSKKYQKNTAGVSLVEVVVVTGIMLVIFSGLFASFDYSLKLIAQSRAKLSAVSLANDRMEYFRSLPYDSVGTVSGIPSGLIPQNSTTTLNGIEFQERVLVEYVDDDADGEGVSDTNAILSDYKRIRLEYQWDFSDQSGEIFMVSNIVPRSIETTAGGGTVRVNVLGPDSLPLSGASVQLINNTLAPTIDVTKYSDASGIVLFSGAPAGSDYEIVVTGVIGGEQYSTTGTVDPAVVANPSTPPFALLEADVSTLTFQIGDLSDLDLTLYSSVTEVSFTDDFSSLTAASSSAVAVSSGDLVLENNLGVYETSGFAYLGPITPATLEGWHTVTVASILPANTSYQAQVYTSPSAGVYSLVSDTDLPGNSVGFADSIIDISALDNSFSEIYLGVTLATTDTATTPRINELSVFYRESVTPASSLTFDIRGNKLLGTLADTTPVYKFNQSRTTDSNGEVSLTDMEFDNYTLSFTSNNIASACPAHPYVQEAGVDGDAEFVLTSAHTDYLRLVIEDDLGRPIPGVSARLQRSGYDQTRTTDVCGNAYFGSGLTGDSDYTLDISATGYSTLNLTNVSPAGGVIAGYVLAP